MIPMYSFVDDHQQNASLSSEVKIEVPAPANGVLVQAITQNVRIKFAGDATASTGFQIKAGDPPLVYPIGAENFSVIEETSGATLEYQFVRIHRLGA